MSITFSPADWHLRQHTVTCICGKTAQMRFPDYTSAVHHSERFVSACGDEFCDPYGAAVEGTAPECQLANVNAAELLEMLGILTEDKDFSDACVGALPAEDMLGRVLTVIALMPEDDGRPAVDVSHPSFGPRIIEGGRPAGYFDQKFADLRTVCEDAKSRGVAVIWG
jgi:hypothetical protein